MADIAGADSRLWKTGRPERRLSPQQIDALLARGVTSVIGCVDLTNDDAIESIGTARDMPLNWGFVGRIDKVRSLAPGGVGRTRGVGGRSRALSRSPVIGRTRNRGSSSIMWACRLCN